VFRVRRSRGEI